MSGSGVIASVIVRTLNEQRYLAQLLEAVARQVPHARASIGAADLTREVVVVDSGSTDRSLEIAGEFGVRVVRISRDEFSFGRSLNRGCAAATGRMLVFVSGHCVPTDEYWLSHLIEPLRGERVEMTYGRQIGGPETKFSEHQLFAKLFPETSAVPQDGYFCNNANSALRRDVWDRLRFDEQLLGLEDMGLAKALVASGGRVGYVAEAVVSHHHHETWRQVRRRYEREAIALQQIRPEWHISPLDFARFLVSSIALDVGRAARAKRIPPLREIVLFRLMQYWGSYAGNHGHRRLAAIEKNRYFYPR